MLLAFQRCRGVVYGLIGDRDMFICELYQRVKLDGLVYVPFTNVYLKKKSECGVSCKSLLLSPILAYE